MRDGLVGHTLRARGQQVRCQGPAQLCQVTDQLLLADKQDGEPLGAQLLGIGGEPGPTPPSSALTSTLAVIHHLTLPHNRLIGQAP